MTDADVLNLQPGSVVSYPVNGRVWVRRIDRVTHIGTCINERSGAYGHAYAMVETDSPTGNGTWSWSLHSDEYQNAYGPGTGYPSHDANGNRLRGFELVEPAEEPPCSTA